MIQRSANAVVYVVIDEKESKQGKGKTDAPEQLEQLREGLMPFQLVKYFSFSSLAVILLFTLFLSWAISRNARYVMLAQSEAYSLLLAKNLNQQIIRGFVLPTVVRYGKIALSNPDQFQLLDKIIRNATRSMKMEDVTIYDSTINIISYSTIEEKVGKKDQGGLEYKKALLGEANSQVHSSGTVLGLLPGTSPVQYRLKTFIPFRLMQENGDDGGQIMGVIEITQDLSHEYDAILRLQKKIIMVSSLVMGILFLVLLIIVSQASRIMEKRVRERLALEKKLHDVERLAHLGTMIATVSHEIKSPLGIVRSTAEILVKRVKKLAPGNENLAEIIVAETTRLNNIVLEFLDFARPQKVRLKSVNINQSISQLLTFVEMDIKEKNIVLNTQLDPELKERNIDPDQLYRALLNVVMNAIQAMPDGGFLTVKTSVVQKDASLSISIADTGVGMSEETLSEVFKPFFTRKSRGTGLGMAITKNIIEQHHGTISVASQKGQGSVFAIAIPDIRA